MTNKPCPICGNSGKPVFVRGICYINCQTYGCFSGSSCDSEYQAWNKWDERAGVKSVLRYYVSSFDPRFDFGTEASYLKRYYPFY